MKFRFVIIVTAMLTCLSMSAAQAYTDQELITIAQNAGVCGNGTVKTAVLRVEGGENVIKATCDTATAFVPFYFAAGGVFAAILAATAGGDGTGSTGSTSGTN